MQMLGLAEFFFEASGIAPSFSSTFLNRCLSLHLHLQVFAFTCCTRRLSIDNLYIYIVHMLVGIKIYRETFTCFFFFDSSNIHLQRSIFPHSKHKNPHGIFCSKEQRRSVETPGALNSMLATEQSLLGLTSTVL